MSKLPQLKEVETFESPILGTLIKFRKVVISDADILLRVNEASEANKGNLELLPLFIELAATLMYGYEETLEERIDYINKMECHKFTDLIEDIRKISLLSGARTEGPVDKKKSEESLQKKRK